MKANEMKKIADAAQKQKTEVRNNEAKKYLEEVLEPLIKDAAATGEYKIIVTEPKVAAFCDAAPERNNRINAMMDCSELLISDGFKTKFIVEKMPGGEATLIISWE